MLKVGDAAPAFRLESDTQGPVSLEDYRGRRLLLFFYPKDNTSGWTAEVLEFQERLSQFEEKGVAIVGVSKDTVASHQRFRARHGFTVPLLADQDLQVLPAYGAWGEKKMYGKVVTGAIRSSVLIGADGKVERVYPKVKAKGHAQQVLDDLSQ